MGNFDLIDYISKSTKRYLSKSEKLFKIEKIMLAFFVKIIKSDEKENIVLFKELQKDLINLKNDLDEGKFVCYDFYRGVKAK